MKRLATTIALLLSLTACHHGEDPNITKVRDQLYRYHDVKMQVTCWAYVGYDKGGLSCIPDRELPGGRRTPVPTKVLTPTQGAK